MIAVRAGALLARALKNKTEISDVNAISRHVTRCFIGGVVALLPIGGVVLTIVYLESTLAESWLARQPYYFPGMGIIAAVLIIYLIGLAVTSFIGSWIWKRVDRMLARLPALGQLYQTLKQVLGYGEGEGALFERVVLVRNLDHDGWELGLVTREDRAGSGQSEGETRLTVFVPAAPTPTAGRLVIVDPSATRPLDVSVGDALKTLVSIGKTPLPGKSA